MESPRVAAEHAALGGEAVHADIVRFHSDVVEHAHFEGDADQRCVGTASLERGVVVPAPAAEPTPVAREGDAGNEPHIDVRRRDLRGIR